MGQPANHYVVCGKGLEAVIDTSGLDGRPAAVSLRVDGYVVDDAELRETMFGLEVTALVNEVPDSHATQLRLVLPEVNVVGQSEAVPGVALFATARSSIGGPAILEGPLQVYEVRPAVVTASVVLS